MGLISGLKVQERVFYQKKRNNRQKQVDLFFLSDSIYTSQQGSICTFDEAARKFHNWGLTRETTSLWGNQNEILSKSDPFH